MTERSITPSIQLRQAGHGNGTMKRIPLEGQTFGKWLVLEYIGCFNGKKSYYLCRCEGCGQEYQIRADRLTGGKTTQCAACRHREMRKDASN